MERLNLSFRTFVLAHNNNLLPSKRKRTSTSKAQMQFFLLEKYKIFVNADVCINTGNFEYFIHDLNVSVDDAKNEKYAKLIEESEGYDFSNYYDALDEGLFRAVQYLIKIVD